MVKVTPEVAIWLDSSPDALGEKETPEAVSLTPNLVIIRFGYDATIYLQGAEAAEALARAALRARDLFAIAEAEQMAEQETPGHDEHPDRPA